MSYTLNSGRFFYWLYVDCDGCLADAIVDFIPLIALAMVLLWIFIRVKKLSCLLSLFFFSIVCPLSFFSMGAFQSSSSRHLDEVYVESKLWRLAYWDSGGSDGVYYAVFQCDSLGINCDEVHFINISRLSDKSTPELIVDGQQRSVVIRNSGGNLYKHEF